MKILGPLLVVNVVLVGGGLALVRFLDALPTHERSDLPDRRTSVAVEPPPAQPELESKPQPKSKPQPPPQPKPDSVETKAVPETVKALIARGKNPADRQQLERHLQRFFLPPPSKEKTETGDWVERRLRDVRRQHVRLAPKVKALPVPDADAVEKRRIEQLEKLRQRDAVGLLDHIHAGLAWLALHQAQDGHFSPAAAAARCKELGHQPPCTSGSGRYRISATALAAMAFLDFRDQDRHGLFEPYLARAVRWLLDQQKEDGTFPSVGRPQYTNAIALMALGQAAASTKLEEVHEAVRRGLIWFEANRGAGGGFRYRPGEPGDLSVSGWVAQAVEMARLAEIEVPPELPRGLEQFLHLCWRGDHRFSYQPGGPERATLNPVGILMGHILWAEPAPDVIESWRKWLKRGAGKRPRLYALYYGVRVAIALERGLPDPWRGWVFALAAEQTREGSAAGAFRKRGGSWLARAGLPIYTAVSVLTLEHALYLR